MDDKTRALIAAEILRGIVVGRNVYTDEDCKKDSVAIAVEYTDDLIRELEKSSGYDKWQ